MSLAPTHHRFPRAGLDPITDPADALVIVAAAMRRPRRAETIAIVLDADRCGIAIVVVAGTTAPDAVVDVAEFVATSAARGGSAGGFVIATVRPGAESSGPPPGGRSDVDRWLEMSDIAEQAGCELVEWFVIGREISCPRDRLGEMPRW